MTDWTDFAERIQNAGQQKLGEPVTYTPHLGTPESITGIFTGAAVRVELEGDTAVESSRPVLSVHLDDLAVAPVRGGGIVVRGTSYLIREIQPDGEGDADLVLGVV